MSRLLLTALALVSAVPALAQEATPADVEKTKTMLTVGALAANLPDYEGSNDSRWTVAPIARARVADMSITLRGNRAWADLVPNDSTGIDFELGPLFNLNLNRVQKAKDPRVAALGKIRGAAELGVQAGLGYQGLITSAFDKLTVTVGYVHDLGSVHKSYVLSPAIDYSTPLSRRMFVDLNLSASYAGNGYAQRYFGVTPAGAAASGLPVFNARRGWKDWTVGGVFDYALTGDLTGGLQLIAAGSYRRLLNDFADSPVVSVAGSRHQWTGAIGLAYTF